MTDRPSVPPTLIYDHSSDPEDQLWDRLHERLQLSPELRVIVHLRSGTTIVGHLRYYNNFHLTLASGGQLHDILYSDVAHILQASDSA